jgi:hypothetical protein
MTQCAGRFRHGTLDAEFATCGRPCFFCRLISSAEGYTDPKSSGEIQRCCIWKSLLSAGVANFASYVRVGFSDIFILGILAEGPAVTKVGDSWFCLGVDLINMASCIWMGDVSVLYTGCRFSHARGDGAGRGEKCMQDFGRETGRVGTTRKT